MNNISGVVVVSLVGVLGTYVIVDFLFIDVQTIIAKTEVFLSTVAPVSVLTIFLLIAGFLLLYMYSRMVKLSSKNAAMDDSRNRLEAVLNTVVDGIITINKDKIIQSVNPAVEKIFGYRSEELVGKNVNTLVPSEHHDEHDSYVDTYIRTKKARIIGIGREVHGKRKDGSIVPLELGISEVEQDGEPFFVGIVRDISARKKDEHKLKLQGEELKDSQMRLTAVLNTVVDGIITIDQQGVIRSFNPAAEKITGYKLGEVIGRNVSMLMPAPYHEEHDEYLANYLSTGNAKIIGIGREVEARKRNGDIFPMELGISELDVAGERMFVGLIRDITERKAAERELADSNEKLKSILDTVVDGIISINENGYIESFNPAAEKIFGYSSDEIMGSNVKVLMPELYRREHDGYIRNYIETGEAQVIGIGREVTARRKDETEFPMELGVSEMMISGQRKFVGIIRDVSQRKSAEDKLVEYANDLELKTIEADEEREKAIVANQLKSEFLANMSHEIRTPMNGIVGITSVLLSGEIDSQYKDKLETIRTCGESLLEIINDILDLSKIEADSITLEKVNFNLHLGIIDILKLMENRARDNNVELIFRYAPGTPQNIKGDPGRIRQILVNLIGNAIKFTKNGIIVVDVEQRQLSEEAVTLAFHVRDTGIGIPENKQKIIFDNFSQADPTTTRNYGGTGLGLAISKRLVELMGGKIGVESKVGVGSTFWFEILFPLGEQDEKRTELPAYDLNDIPVLIVDDQEVNQDILREYADDMGMRPTVCTFDDPVIKILHHGVDCNNSYPVVLICSSDPEARGSDLAKRIKSDEVLDKTALIMISSMGMRGDAQEVKKAGFDGYLVKPFHTDVLRGAISIILEARGRGEKIDLVNRHTVFDVTEPEKSEAQCRGGYDARILVVEDNVTNQIVIEKLLEIYGCKVELATNGIEAIEKVKEGHYDLVFMDCLMPEMNGYDATRSIRSLEGEKAETRIIALTANALAEDKQKCIDAGMDDYLPKPFKDEVLGEMLEKWLPTNRGRVAV